MQTRSFKCFTPGRSFDLTTLQACGKGVFARCWVIGSRHSSTTAENRSVNFVIGQSATAAAPIGICKP